MVRNDVGSLKMLEFGAVSAGFLGQRHEIQGANQVTVVVCGDIGNEIGRLVWTDQAIA